MDQEIKTEDGYTDDEMRTQIILVCLYLRGSINRASQLRKC